MCEIIFCDSGIAVNQTDYIKTYDVGFGTYDSHGHGSSLTKLVHSINNIINLSSIRVLDEKNEGSLEGLILALEKCLELDARVICLALSIDQSVTENDELKDMVKDVYKSGKIIVAALQNRAEYSIPAGYKDVIGVKACPIMGESSAFWHPNEKIQCTLPMEDFFWKSLGEEYIRLGGNSVACAFMAEHVADTLKENGNLSFGEISNLLSMQRSADLNYYKLFNIGICDCEEETTIEEIIRTIDKEFGIDDSDDLIISKMTSFKQFKDYIKELERKGLEINRKTLIRKRNVFDVDSLVGYLAYQK